MTGEIPPDEARRLALEWLDSAEAERYVRRLLASPPPLIEDPDDILQEGRVKVLGRFPGPWADPVRAEAFPAGYCKSALRRIVIDKKEGVPDAYPVPYEDAPEQADPGVDVAEQATDAALYEQLAGKIHGCCRYSDPGEQAAVALWFAQCLWFGGVEGVPLPYPTRHESEADDCWWQAVATIYPRLREPVPEGREGEREKARRRDLKRRLKAHGLAALRCACDRIGWTPPPGDLDD
jgi:hypothetical protein